MSAQLTAFLLAVWLTAAPDALETVTAMAVGGALAALACVRGAVPDRLGGGWATLWRPDRAEAGRAT